MSKSNCELVEAIDLAVSQAIQLLAMMDGLRHDPPEQVPEGREAKNLLISSNNAWCLLDIAREKLVNAARDINILLERELKAHV